MGIEVNWLPPKSRDGVREGSFNFEVSGTVVPGVMWLPAEPGSPVPLILLGHGGSGHKCSSRNLELSRWFAKEAGMASMAIDGPYHGERVTSPLGAGEYQGLIREEGAGLVVDRMVRDWRAAIEAMASVDSIDTAALGYIGLSMGTRFGVPLASALGGDLRCAVFGKFGLVEAAGLYEGVDMADRLTADAGQVSAPTLLHVQWDDELFPRQGQFALFDALGSSEKEMIAYPGGHRELNPMAPVHWRSFVARHLTHY
jgi:dienelactone hydrolase